MKHLYILVILQFYFLNLSNAQVSGYMGKRLIGKYDTYTNIYYPLSGKTPDNPFSVRHCAGLDYTITKNISVSLAYTYSKTSFNKFSETGSLYNNGFAIGTSVFSDEGLSPLGHFFKYEIQYYKSEYSIFVDDFYDIYGQSFYGRIRKNGTVNNYILSFTVGQSAVFFDRLYLNYGLKLGYRLGTFFGSIADMNDFNNDGDIKREVRWRNLKHNLWGVQFGLGYLIF